MKKPFYEFNKENWKNTGIYIILVSLLLMFVGEEYKTGAGLFLTGILFLAFHQIKKA